MASVSDLLEPLYKHCRGVFHFLRRFLRLIPTTMNLHKNAKNCIVLK